MGTDVCSSAIYRLMEFGYRCGREPSLLICACDDANCGHQIPLMRFDWGRDPILKYCQVLRRFWVPFLVKLNPFGIHSQECTTCHSFKTAANKPSAHFYTSIW